MKAAATKTNNMIQEKTENITSYFCTPEEKCLVVTVQITSMLQLKVQKNYFIILQHIWRNLPDAFFFNGFNSKDFIHIFSAKI